MTAGNAKQRILESSESNHSEAAPFSQALRLAFSRVCIQSFARGDLSMHRSQQWVKLSIMTLMFALTSLSLSVEADQRRQAMSFSISSLLIRNLHDVFGENDPARRRAAIDEIFIEDCVFYEPSGRVYRGHDEIDRVAGMLRAMHPDFRYQPIAEPEELGNAGRVKWVEGRPGGAPAVAGTDFIITRDGRIAAIYLFFDKLP
jgi:hypothetical protein